MSKMCLSLIAGFLFGHGALASSNETLRLKDTDLKRVVRQIDELVEKGLRQHNVSANPGIDDATFLRRVYLTLAGRLPTLAEQQAFRAEPNTDRRAALVDRLLVSQAYVSHQYNLWADLLRIMDRHPNLVNQGAVPSGQPYQTWLRDALAANAPYDRMVHELLSTKGGLWEKGKGATGYYFRDLGMPLDHMSNTTEVFLGTQMACAQCHDHPFDTWTQKDFYHMAAFTAGLGRLQDNAVNDFNRLIPNTSSDNTLTQARTMFRHAYYDASHGGSGSLPLPADYSYDDGKPGDVMVAKPLFSPMVSVSLPKAEAAPVKSGNKNRTESRRESRKEVDIDSRMIFADWMVSPENPRFTLVAANRVWREVMGLGLIEPYNDIKENTVASNPELMTYLTRLLVSLNYDLREFRRVLVNTRTFHREVTRQDVEPGVPYHFPGPVMRRLSAEQLWDSLITLTRADVDTPRARPAHFMSDIYEKRKSMSTAQFADYVRSLSTAEGVRNLNDITRQLQQEKNEAEAFDSSETVAALQSELRRLSNRHRDVAKKGRNEAKIIAERIDELREKISSLSHLRASDLPSPAPAGHFVREFGASDRQLINGSSEEATITQSLAMLNGFVDDYITRNRHSVLMKNLGAVTDPREKIYVAFNSILVRDPEPWELDMLLRDTQRTAQGLDQVIWALLNTHEFMSWK